MLFFTKSRLPGLRATLMKHEIFYWNPTGYKWEFNLSPQWSGGLYRDFEVFCLMWIPINLSPAEIRLPPSVGNKLWCSGRVEGGEVTCQSAPFITGTKRSRFFLLTAKNLLRSTFRRCTFWIFSSNQYTYLQVTLKPLCRKKWGNETIILHM